MEHDLMIAGGTLVDGTGAAPIKADLAVSNGRITRIPILRDRTLIKIRNSTMIVERDHHGFDAPAPLGHQVESVCRKDIQDMQVPDS